MNLNLFDSVPEGLTRRARSFVVAHGVRADAPDVEQYRPRWLELGIPTSEIDRAVAFQQRWGGLVLPPAPEYDGGPRYFEVDTPDGSPSETSDGSTAHGWWFEAGLQRTAIPYSFMIGPTGEFGIHAQRWVPLHATIEGWVESLALAHHAAMCAKQITKVTGEKVDTLDLDGFEPVTEVRGLADTWWRGTDALVAVTRGNLGAWTRPPSVPRGSTRAWMSGVYAGRVRGDVPEHPAGLTQPVGVLHGLRRSHLHPPLPRSARPDSPAPLSRGSHRANVTIWMPGVGP